MVVGKIDLRGYEWSVRERKLDTRVMYSLCLQYRYRDSEKWRLQYRNRRWSAVWGMDGLDTCQRDGDGIDRL